MNMFDFKNDNRTELEKLEDEKSMMGVSGFLSIKGAVVAAIITFVAAVAKTDPAVVISAASITGFEIMTAILSLAKRKILMKQIEELKAKQAEAKEPEVEENITR